MFWTTDTVCKLHTFIQQCHSFLLTTLAFQYMRKDCHTDQRGGMLGTKHPLPRLHRLHEQLYALRPPSVALDSKTSTPGCPCWSVCLNVSHRAPLSCANSQTCLFA